MYLEVWNPSDQHPRRAQRMIIHPDTLGYGYWRSTGERVERPAGLNEAVIRDLMETMNVPISVREAEAIMRDVRGSRSIVYHAYDDYSRVARVRGSLLWWTLWLACIAAMLFRAARRTRPAALAIPAASVTN
jgi:hypothetical protein